MKFQNSFIVRSTHVCSILCKTTLVHVITRGSTWLYSILVSYLFWHVNLIVLLLMGELAFDFCEIFTKCLSMLLKAQMLSILHVLIRILIALIYWSILLLLVLLHSFLLTNVYLLLPLIDIHSQLVHVSFILMHLLEGQERIGKSWNYIY